MRKVQIKNTDPKLYLIAARAAQSFNNLKEGTQACTFVYGDDVNPEQFEADCYTTKAGMIVVTVKDIDDK